MNARIEADVDGRLVVIGVDLHGMNPVQKAALAVTIEPQVAALMVARGEIETKDEPGPRMRKALERAGEITGAAHTTVYRLNLIARRDPKVVARMLAGELSLAEGGHAVGLRDAHDTYSRLPLVFGQKDKWKDCTIPLRRYLEAWATRDYEFTHLRPADAAARLPTIDKLIDGLEKARADLQRRAVKSRYAAPQERKERKNP